MILKTLLLKVGLQLGIPVGVITVVSEWASLAFFEVLAEGSLVLVRHRNSNLCAGSFRSFHSGLT